uniref:Uncharacterized protein n=1 Tax=Ditylenchus dipsaci TaxID=166011 RepID=A0A915D3L0_9BILA
MLNVIYPQKSRSQNACLGKLKRVAELKELQAKKEYSRISKDTRKLMEESVCKVSQHELNAKSCIVASSQVLINQVSDDQVSLTTSNHKSQSQSHTHCPIACGISNCSSFDDSGCGTSLASSGSSDSGSRGWGQSNTPPNNSSSPSKDSHGSYSAMTKIPGGQENANQDSLNNNNNDGTNPYGDARDENCGSDPKIHCSEYESNDENTNSNGSYNLLPSDNISNSLSQGKRRMSMCAGCRLPIIDRYILRVQPNLEFHSDCLVCSDCQRPLDENCTAFVRSGKTYCKQDYFKLFGRRCNRCHMQFERTDMVMRARGFVFHLNCFSCVSCEKRLAPGEQYVIRSDELYCRPDCFRMPDTSPSMRSVFFPSGDDISATSLRQNWVAPPASQPLMSCINPSSNHLGATGLTTASLPDTNLMMDSAVSPNPDAAAFGQFDSNPFNPDQPLAFQRPSWTNPPNHSEFQANQSHSADFGGHHSKPQMHSSLSSSVNSPADYSDNPDSVAAPSSTNSGCCANPTGLSGASSTTTGSNLTSKKSKKDKPAQRVRTVLNEAQLKILKQMYNSNQRPDTTVKEHLVERTGLSARVIRVWFQNKRCKDKKRQNALKEMQQSQEKEQALHGVRLNGIGPLVAGSPTSMVAEACTTSQSGGSNSLLNPIDIRQFPKTQLSTQPNSSCNDDAANAQQPNLRVNPEAYLASQHLLQHQQNMEFGSNSPLNDI